MKLTEKLNQLKNLIEFDDEQIREGFLELQGYDIHVLIIYTNKNHSREELEIDNFLTKKVKELTFRILESKAVPKKRDKVYISLDTNGGDAQAAIQIYDFLKSTFRDPTVIIPESAWSAGTAFSLCCHRVILLAEALLGPIDTQVRLQEDDTYHKSAFSYIDGVSKYIEGLMKRVGDRNDPLCKTYQSELKALLSPIDLMDFGHCYNMLDQTTNLVATRHLEHLTTLNHFSEVYPRIWNDFTMPGKWFGHDYGFNFSALKDKSLFEGHQDYLQQITFGSILYDVISIIHQYISGFLQETPSHKAHAWIAYKES